MSIKNLHELDFYKREIELFEGENELATYKIKKAWRKRAFIFQSKAPRHLYKK